ncbi:tyrosine--tRNA ligase [candidate division WS5 bacterium]|uniref:Tyrosine--tRNA ligase n=1 Tax=candidate division WS5 bacterium TaxID=2093353 RepID=A0A419DAF4_9BACT|nr:MAG: tyrosine--tRNA ligase [candidate division WS5 bacterium]
MSKEKEIEELLTRGVTHVIERDHLEKALKSGKKLRVKHGIDPTGPKIHIGRGVVLWTLRKLQAMGHKVVLIVGDFTAQIGDASDKDAARQPLTPEQIKNNLKTYQEQLGKIIDLKKAEIHYNSEWLGKTSGQEILEGAMEFTVAQMIERENFKERFEAGKPIGLHEILYPVLQGLDSVAIKADLEIGGNDQLFNMMAGRVLQKRRGQKPQDVMTFELIEGTDGRKMSTSWGNVILIEDAPNDMYGKIMSIKDNLIIRYFTMVTDVSMDEIKKYEKELKNGANPRDIKAKLAFEITKRYHGTKEAEKAAQEFEKIFKKKEKPTDMPKAKFKKGEKLVDVLVAEKIVSSKSDARRLIQQSGVKDNDKAVTDIDYVLNSGKHVVQVGKRRFIELSEK